jgi:hypothetical protein
LNVRMKRQNKYLFFICLLLVGGCISRTPNDVSFVSAQAVDLHDQLEIPGPRASLLPGVVGDREQVRTGQSVTAGEKPHRLLLRVAFTSATNISNYVVRNSYSLGVYTSFCDRPNYDATLSYLSVYSGGYSLGMLETYPIVETGGVISYYFFVSVSGEARLRDIPPREAYDLRQKPEDLCFVLRGGNEAGGYRSNTVTIPKDAIAAALHEIPTNLRP